MMIDTSFAVQVQALSKVYGTADAVVTALAGVTLGFHKGTFTAVMGPSGSGKSTLLQCAAGLDHPTSGEVLVGGIRLSALSETALTVLRRKHIGFVFQSFNLLSYLGAEDNVGLPMLLAGRRPDRTVTTAALAAVGLADRIRHRPAQLSGGQQQRVAIARALVTRPQVVFADEPTGNLDSANGRDVLRLLRTAVDEHHQTLVMVTHDPVAASYADRVVFLRDGQVAGDLADPMPQTISQQMTALEALS